MIYAVDDRIQALCRNFELCLSTYNQNSFGAWRLHFHRKTINARSKFGCVSEAIDSHNFVVEHLGYTLVAWGMDSQRAKLVHPNEFFFRFKANERLIVELEQYSIADLSNLNVINLVWDTINNLQLSQTRSQLVTGAKALHHLLPNFIPPIDRRYTGEFFKLYPNHFSYNAKSGCEHILKGFAQIYKTLENQRTDYLSNLVGNADWATSETKLIDNAIVGYVKYANRQNF